MDNAQKKKTPKVTVCVVTYNQEQYIEQCLQSIVDQKGDFELEVIVGDDCSTDNTKNIVDDFKCKYPEIIRVLQYKENIGATENFLAVHDNAKGDFVCHCDGDDYWYEGKIQLQLNLMMTDRKIAQIWHCADCVTDEDKKNGIFPSRLARKFYPKIIDSKDIALSYSLVGHHSTQMYRKKFRVFERNTTTVLDYWIAFCISKHGKSLYLKNILSAYRITESNSITRNKSIKKITVDALADHLKEIINHDKKYAPQAASHACIRMIMSKLRGHDLSKIKPLVSSARNNIKIYFLFKSLIYFLLEKVKS